MNIYHNLNRDAVKPRVAAYQSESQSKKTADEEHLVDAKMIDNTRINLLGTVCILVNIGHSN